MFIAPFWTSLYYSYLDYGQYGTQTPDQIMAASHIAAVNARQVGAFTPVGLAWETMILPSVDRTAPQVPSGKLGRPSYSFCGAQRRTTSAWRVITFIAMGLCFIHQV